MAWFQKDNINDILPDNTRTPVLKNKYQSKIIEYSPIKTNAL